ncbi:hypothetical protein BGLT_04098 [Caballeronia glathei]|jgi:HD-like signal output (HDOD) protein|uniref:Uncharacterized protein n=1 Tax=Caballeronia glathei TaxID=60547 RepID=A0A069PTX0_9BURK|nr:hypothetical protein [Caballeronia glathei]KDR43294.1 hypothetical protein BG61_40760 [Caballeronia glathei]CDY75200.1 hypothetical protein BGLT_04098 [Caballeronia glathei]
MKTDWDLIREMMNTAIDACEQIEAMGYAERHRGIAVEVGGQAVSVQDFIVSAWTFPENIRYRIIRERHDSHADLPYVPEASRIMNAMARACGELIGGAHARPADAAIREMLQWYRAHAVPHLRQAIASDAAEPAP